MSPELWAGLFVMAIVVCGAVFLNVNLSLKRTARRRRDSHEDWHV